MGRRDTNIQSGTSSHSTPRVIPKRAGNIHPGKDWNMNAHSSNIHNSQKVNTTQTSVTDEWINKRLCIHAMEYYLAIRRNEVLIHITTWVNFENTALSERSQSQIEMSRIGNSLDT